MCVCVCRFISPSLNEIRAQHTEAIMSGAGEGAHYSVRVMNAGGSPGKMLSHADGAFHFTQLYHLVPLNIRQHAANL